MLGKAVCVVVAALALLVATAPLTHDIAWAPENSAIWDSGDPPFSVSGLNLDSLPGSAAMAATAPPIPDAPAVQVELDQYGGRVDRNCAGGATGRFYSEIIGTQWFLCTPAGHAMWGQGAYAAGPQVKSNKYHSEAEAFAATAARLKAWGFNLLPPYSEGQLNPYSPWMSKVKMPYIPIFRPGLYGMVKHGVAGPLDDAIKDLANGASPYFSRVSNAGMVDWADTTRLKSALHYMLAVDVNSFARVLHDKVALDYIIGIAVEDSDQTWGFWGGGQGDPFETQPPGKGTAHGGYLTAIISGQQQANATKNLLFTDHTVYTKRAWQAYLQKKYRTIEALNAAWGSNYTSFGSSASEIKGESIAATNGREHSFTHVLASGGAVVPGSIQILEDGKMIAGDCFHPNSSDACNPRGGINSGAIYGPGLSAGSISYDTRLLTIVFAQPWHVVEGGTCTAAGSCTAIFSSSNDPGVQIGDRVAVQGRYAMAEAMVTNRQTGGSYRPTGPFCSPSMLTNAVFITYSWHGGDVFNWGYCTEGGSAKLAKLAPPPAGHALTVNYQVNGWDAGGTGLMDEDGRPAHTWLGSDAFALRNANPNFAADARGFLGQLAGDYFGAMASQIKADFIAAGAAPPMYVGPDTFGTWSTPPRKEVLQAAAPYLGMAIMTVKLTQAELDYISQWLGKPYFGATFLHANRDSPFLKSDLPDDFRTQAARGAAFYSSIQTTLGTRSNGVNPYLGNLWWQYGDNAGERANWGLVTLKDNAYDGHEAVQGRVTCSPPLDAYICGGEEGNYGDVITAVRAANQLWLRH